MKLKSRAYVVTMGTILPGINSVRIDDENGVSHEVNGHSKDLESAMFMCNALNNWRESFADVIAKKFFNPETNEWEFRYDEK